jgi:Methyltransferase domain
MIGRLGRAKKTEHLRRRSRQDARHVWSRAELQNGNGSIRTIPVGVSVELFDMVMTYAGRPVRTDHEIGAGTGKATRLFAQRAVTVTATAPDGAILAELREHMPANVATVHAAFEELRPSERYGPVYAAAALHWADPGGRWSRGWAAGAG